MLFYCCNRKEVKKNGKNLHATPFERVEEAKEEEKKVVLHDPFDRLPWFVIVSAIRVSHHSISQFLLKVKFHQIDSQLNFTSVRCHMLHIKSINFRFFFFI